MKASIFYLRPVLALFIGIFLAVLSQDARAQSVMDNLPPQVGQDQAETETPPQKENSADTFIVHDVNVDVTADTAAHARDQALLQAEHLAFAQLCGRLSLPDTSSKISDDALSAMVQSFEVQSERLSSVRYIGVFTIQFKPTAVGKKTGYLAPVPEVKNLSGPLAHVTAGVATDSLATWAQIKHRLILVPSVSHIDVIDLAKGTSHIDIIFAGSLDDLKQALTTQGLVLRQVGDGYMLYDGSMVPR